MKTQSSQPSVPLPHIHALCMHDNFADALQSALASHNLSFVPITYHDCALSILPPTVRFDAIVSPANSYGRLDGGFDDAISRAFSPKDDYLALTKVAQQKLYDEWRGFAPPGTCTLIRIPQDFQARSNNAWGTKYLALCPTMRVPQEVTWDREVVYECVWSLLCAIDKHNRSVRAGSGDARDEIQSLLMVPMGTGVGRISAEKWAAQTALALKHYIDAIENPTKWSALEPIQIYEHVNEVVDTYMDTLMAAAPGKNEDA